MPTLFNISGSYFLSAPLVISTLYRDVSRDNIKFINNSLIMGERKIPLNARGLHEINFQFEFKEFSYLEVIEGKVDRKVIDNRIILLGFNATGTGDYLPTPASKRYHGTKLLASAVQTLMD